MIKIINPKTNSVMIPDPPWYRILQLRFSNYGYMVYIVVPATIIKPSSFEVNDIGTIVNSVFILVRLTSLNQNILNALHLIYWEWRRLFWKPMHNNEHTKKFLYKQLKYFVTLSPTFSQKILQIFEKLKFHFSDITGEETIKVCKWLVKNQQCFVAHRNNVG